MAVVVSNDAMVQGDAPSGTPAKLTKTQRRRLARAVVVPSPVSANGKKAAKTVMSEKGGPSDEQPEELEEPLATEPVGNEVAVTTDYAENSGLTRQQAVVVPSGSRAAQAKTVSPEPDEPGEGKAEKQVQANHNAEADLALESHSSYPPLPVIDSHQCRAEIFLQEGVFQRKASLFEDPEENLFPDNKRLAQLGDAVLLLVTRALVRNKYPRLGQMSAQHMTEQLVSNAAIAHYAVHYGLHDRVVVLPGKEAVRGSAQLQADVFEAYIGGLHETHGYDAVYGWLSKVLEPAAEKAYQIARHRHAGYVKAKILAEQPTKPPAHKVTKSSAQPDPPASTDEGPRISSPVDSDTPPSNASELENEVLAAEHDGDLYTAQTQLDFLHEKYDQGNEKLKWEYSSVKDNGNMLWIAKAFLWRPDNRSRFLGKASSTSRLGAMNLTTRMLFDRFHQNEKPTTTSSPVVTQGVKVPIRAPTALPVQGVSRFSGMLRRLFRL